MVWYSANTTWWTHDPRDLQPGPIPLDSLGSPLYEGDLKTFIENAERNPDYYGQLGLETLMACHHKNFKPEMGDSRSSFGKFKTFEDALLAIREKNPEFQLLTP